jgi:HB1/ASXL restriction endonuclease-like protein with HTH domain
MIFLTPLSDILGLGAPISMEWKDAIVKVLSDAGTPIHYTEIAEQIVERGLREELTATPANTVAAIITISLKNEATQSPFFRTARGYYTLRSLQQQSLVLAQEELIDTESSETTGVVNAFGMFWDRSKVPVGGPAENPRATAGGIDRSQFLRGEGRIFASRFTRRCLRGTGERSELGQAALPAHRGSPNWSVDEVLLVRGLSCRTEWHA